MAKKLFAYDKPLASKNIKEKIIKFIAQHELFSPKDGLLVALSGGIDSVCLLHLLLEMGFENLTAAHCNFQLRAEESEQDQQFCLEICNTMGIKHALKRFDTQAFAHANGLSIQVAARTLRYQWFEQLMNEQKTKYLLTAHHQTDNLETLLINQIRGTGIAGLHGILPKNNYIVRPLLCLTKTEINNYASEENIIYREDSSNASDKYIRNSIRHHILPLLQAINPQIEQTFFDNGTRIYETQQIYNKKIEELKSQICLKIDDTNTHIDINTFFKNQGSPTLLFELLNDFGFKSPAIDAIFESLTKQSGKLFFSQTHQLLKDRTTLMLQPISKINNKNQSFLWQKNTPDYQFPLGEISFVIKKKLDINIGIQTNYAYFDADKVEFPLTLRPWQEGDYFMPFGMRGKKKVSNFLSDVKVNLFEKDNIWVVQHSNKDILWLIDYRTDNRYRVGEATQKILVIKFVPNPI